MSGLRAGDYGGDIKTRNETASGKQIPFKAVVGLIWRYELVQSFASCGFCAIATFITLFYVDKDWNGAVLP